MEDGAAADGPTEKPADTGQSPTRPKGFDPARPTSPTDPEPLADPLDLKDLLPAVWLFVHLARHRHRDGGVARVEGSAPVTAEWVRTHLGERCTFKITPVLDPRDQIPVDA